MEQTLGASEIETLVQQLYLPYNKPEHVESLQSRLQEIQRSCSWDIPDKLLDSPDPNVRFFAALTFTVKINQHGSSLEEKDLNALLNKLLYWLITLVERRESPFVLRKLCSTLVTYFILPNAKWRLCIRHVMCCLHSHQVVDETAIHDLPSTSKLAELLTPAACTAILTFATILAEDASRIDHSSQNLDYCHKRVEANIRDITAMMLHAFQLLVADNPSPPIEVLQCYLSWFAYASEEYRDASEQLATLRTLFVPAMKCLTLESTFEPATQFFIDLFTSGDLKLEKHEIDGFHSLLSSNLAQEQFAKLESGQEDDDAILMAQLALALGQCMANRLIRSHGQFDFLMDLYHRLTRTQNFESIDQGLSNAIIDFWEIYTSFAPSVESLREDDRPKFEAAETHWLQAMEELVSAAALPLEENGELAGLMNDDPFSEFRSRTRMAIEGSYVEFQLNIFAKLVGISIALDNEVQRGQLQQEQKPVNYAMGRLEFALFCICGLSDSMEPGRAPNSYGNTLLEQLFGSTIFSNLTSSGIRYSEKVRKRAISIIGEQESFFSSRIQQLLAALSMLFRALEQPGLHQVSALAIFKLAENNRAHLTSQITQFLVASERLLPSDLVDNLTKEYIVGAVGAIIQAHAVNETWYSALMQICNTIQNSMEMKLQQNRNTQHFSDERQTYGLEAMGYLKALGKALQAPTNISIVIDDDDDDDDEAGEEREEDEGAEQSTQQSPEMLARIQTSLARFMELIVQPHRDDGPLLVALCDVLKSGFRERQPGPFTFDPEVTTTFVTSTPFSNPCLDVAVATGASFLTSTIAKREGSYGAIVQLVQFTRMIIGNLEDPDADPDLSHSCVELVSCLCQSHLRVLTDIPMEDASVFFSFAIKCLQSTHQPSKRSASQVWKILFESRLQAEPIRGFIQKLFNSMGSALTSALVGCFGGNAARSELNWLTEPFRKMVFTQPRAKGWIEAALFSPDFPSSRPSDAEKRKFAAQVMHLRGGRQTQAVVKDFWLSCRGAPIAYG